MNGFLLVDKPVNITSFDVIRKIRKKFGIKKIGHSGTLDPMATGLIILGFGKATKLLSYISKQDKEYLFTIKFGETTDTLDREGKIIETKNKIPAPDDIESVCKVFIGKIPQTPPKYSSVKVNGIRAYKLARENKDFTLSQRIVNIKSLEMLNFFKDKSIGLFKVRCSSGTYVRTLAADIARKLDTVGYTYTIRRLSIGQNNISQSVNLYELLKKDSIYNVKNMAEMNYPFPVISADKIIVEKLMKHGRMRADLPSDIIGIKHLDELICIVEKFENDYFKIKKLFV